MFIVQHVRFKRHAVRMISKFEILFFFISLVRLSFCKCMCVRKFEICIQNTIIINENACFRLMLLFQCSLLRTRNVMFEHIYIYSPHNAKKGQEIIAFR